MLFWAVRGAEGGCAAGDGLSNPLGWLLGVFFLLLVFAKCSEFAHLALFPAFYNVPPPGPLNGDVPSAAEE